jgi:transitional endoplasmic reticulum ATPase
MDDIQQSVNHLERGLDAQAQGDTGAARSHYLQAAEALFRAARRAKGALKAARTEQAEELLARAEALRPAPAPRRESPPARRSPAPAEKLAVGDGEAAPWLVAERPRVRFADVAGLEEVKEQVRLKLIYPFTHPELAAEFGVRAGGGIVLYGPPGTGKTLIARAVAGEVDAAFFTVKPSEIMSKWVGEAEQNVERLFAAARRHARAVIFIDEVESLAPRRRSSGSTVMQRLVPQILAELDGFEQNEGTLLFIGATNEPWALDAAVMRPGRFDEKVYVPLPELPARRRILELNLVGRPLAPEVDLDALAQELDGYSGADIANICRKACALPFIEAVEMGSKRLVMPADFQTVMEQVTPSVSPQENRRYADFAAG